MTAPLHPGLASGGFESLTLAEQLGNIGSEVSRALTAAALQNDHRMRSALDRALELFDLTIGDPKNRGRLKEVCRAREVVCDFFFGGNRYSTTPQSIDRYFTQFALYARRAR